MTIWGWWSHSKSKIVAPPIARKVATFSYIHRLFYCIFITQCLVRKSVCIVYHTQNTMPALVSTLQGLLQVSNAKNLSFCNGGVKTVVF